MSTSVVCARISLEAIRLELIESQILPAQGGAVSSRRSTANSREFHGAMILKSWNRPPEFLTATAVAIVILLLLIYLLHKRRSLSRIDTLLDERLAERTRLARDLNDSFLQTVEASKLLADNALSKNNNVAEMRQALEKLSEWLGQATAEGKSALDSLRLSTESRNELAEAFYRATEERAAPESMEVTFSLAGEAREMHPIVRDEIYRIGYEAIRNAYMHSKATHLRVDLRYGRDLFLRIIDNGPGFDLAPSLRGDQPQSGLGRMQEAAARIGGELTVSSSVSHGTEVRLRVPGSVIFRQNTPLFRRLAKHKRARRKRD